MKLRDKLLLSHITAIFVVVLAVVVSVRSIAVDAVRGHMGGMMDGMMDMMTRDIQEAVARGVTEALLWGVGLGVVVAAIASYLLATWTGGAVSRLAQAAQRIAQGDYGERVSYEADDEIGEFVEAFNHMAAEIEETEHVRRELLSTVSHELRTPLMNIQGYMEGLMDGVVPEDPSTYQLVHREAGRLSRLVSDIEHLSRVEAGAERLSFARVEPESVVEEAAKRLRPGFEEKGVALQTVVSPETPAMWADEDKLLQILVNLLGNARKYTPAGGEVTVRVAPEGAAASFTVEDTGVGIPSEDLPHIFERFYRVDRSRSAEGGGAGIGLAITRSLVEQMGGAIRAESEPGKGSRMHFTIPAAGAGMGEGAEREAGSC